MDIWDALRKRDESAVKALIKAKKIDVNESGAGDQTPLHMASELNLAGSVTALIAAGAKVGVEDGQLRTPLLLACESKAWSSAKVLIDAGAPLGARDKNDMTPLHWIASFGELSLAKLAISKGAEVDSANYQMQTPLWFAVTKGHLSVANALVDAGASAAQKDDTNSGMMHLAMQHGGGNDDSTDSTTFLKRLLSASTDVPRDVNAADREKRTPLHWACGKNTVPCVRVLIEAGADVNAKDWAEHTPLHWACPGDAVQSARALVGAGANAEAVDRDKRTPLHWAADKSAERCLRFLLEEAGVKAVDAVDWCGHSALHKAARRGSLGCVQLLLDKGADPMLAAMQGETPGDVATDPECKKVLAPAPGTPSLKRKRTMSSNSVTLEGQLPSAAEAFYAACKGGDNDAAVKLCADSIAAKVGSQLSKSGVLGKGVEVGSMHVSTKTLAVLTELSSGPKKQAVLHKLVFDEEGLIAASEIYAAM